MLDGKGVAANVKAEFEVFAAFEGDDMICTFALRKHDRSLEGKLRITKNLACHRRGTDYGPS
jgi:hypothetical protein